MPYTCIKTANLPCCILIILKKSLEAFTFKSCSFSTHAPTTTDLYFLYIQLLDIRLLYVGFLCPIYKKTSQSLWWGYLLTCLCHNEIWCNIKWCNIKSRELSSLLVGKDNSFERKLGCPHSQDLVCDNSKQEYLPIKYNGWTGGKLCNNNSEASRLKLQLRYQIKTALW